MIMNFETDATFLRNIEGLRTAFPGQRDSIFEAHMGTGSTAFSQRYELDLGSSCEEDQEYDTALVTGLSLSRDEGTFWRQLLAIGVMKIAEGRFSITIEWRRPAHAAEEQLAAWVLVYLFHQVRQLKLLRSAQPSVRTVDDKTKPE